MMGKTHMAVAIATYCAYTLPTDLREIPIWGTGLGIVLFTSLLPDIDEPRSRIGGLLMPIIPSWLRPLAFLLVGGYLIYTGWIHAQWMLLGIGLSLLFFVFVKHRESPTHGIIGLLLISSLLYSYDSKFLFPVLIGYGSHLFLDLITEGISLFWPFRIRLRITLMKTNSWLERWLVYRGAQGLSLYFLGQTAFRSIQDFIG